MAAILSTLMCSDSEKKDNHALNGFFAGIGIII